jgi:putative ABC transport system ATP-binding protein
MVLDLLLDRNKRAGTTLVLVTHDPEVASRADRKIVLKDGLVVEDTLPNINGINSANAQIVTEETHG